MDFANINNITITGRIASGATTLAQNLANFLEWEFLEGGRYSDEFFAKIKQNEMEVNLRPDKLDLDFDNYVKYLLMNEKRYVIQSHLSGFMAQGIDNTFKILTVCEDKFGNDKPEIRIDRLINRKNISAEEARMEVQKREEGNIKKWRKLYVPDDPEWVYWDKKYYDLVINTYALNKDEGLACVLEAIGYNAER
ncbi:MAG TPA: cytidylate kinase family protein [Patescibacteria group bacterium]|nr:cytidylate kinase family protein [Patescibacteria group bacterium]